MRILVLGGDGYLGWPTAMALSARGHSVLAVDNYLRRNLARETSSEALMPNPNLPDRAEIWQSVSGYRVRVEIGDCTDFSLMERLFREFQPEAVIHYAEQPSAPYSMLSFDAARRTLNNNVSTTFNVIWATITQCPDCHIIKLGTMGEYGTPNIDIEEGWIDISHNGRTDKFLYPRQSGSLYHTTKIMDTDLLWFYVRTHDLRVTDLMQGPVYGLATPEADQDRRLLPNFHYDAIFGTVINRFVAQAVAGHPLTVYGKGGQARGFLNITDTLQCIELELKTPPPPGTLRVFNQFTEVFTVNQLAEKVSRVANRMGLHATVESLVNPRAEKEEHYYNPKFSKLLDLGLKPKLLSDDVMADLIERVRPFREAIDVRKIRPRHRWPKRP